MVTSGLGVAIGNARAAQGTEDTFGYKYTDSKAPTPSVSYNWVEINATGTNAGLDYYYDHTAAMSIGFDFEFYENTYTQFFICMDGFIGFGYPDYEWYNEQIPYDWSVDDFVAGYWDELYAYDGTVWYDTIGVSPNRQLVVEYENVTTWASSYLMTFEIILNETGDIWVQYNTLSGMTGSSATVGIENHDGTDGVEYSYNTASLTDGLAVRFSAGPVMISPDSRGVGMMGTDVDYALTVKNWQSFSDTFEITFVSSLGWTVQAFDALWSPLTDTDADLYIDTGAVAAGASVTINIRVSIPASPSAYQDVTTVNATSYLSSAAKDFCTLTTDVSSAWFTPPHNDCGLDPAGDGDFDVLSVNVSVNVRVTGWYYLYADLYNSVDTYITSDSVYSYLTAGSRVMNLRFIGYQIRESAGDGMYHADMVLEDGSYILQDTDTYTTGSYLATDFMTRPGLLVTPHDDGVEDTDADGLYDLLFINVTVQASYYWQFRIYVYLYDSVGSYMMYDYVDIWLNAGTSVVSFSFAAWDITDHGVGGTFRADITLDAWVEGGIYFMDSDSHTTPSYLLSEFERRPVVFAQPLDSYTFDYANDTDSDGQYNFLEISTTIDVAIEGDYTIKGILRADSWQPVIETRTVTQHFTVGLHYVDFYFSGWLIYMNSDSDDMDITLEAWSGSSMVDTQVFTTSTYYYYWDFEDSIGRFSTPITDYGLDLDSDSLYDYLVIEVPVEVDEAGYYSVEGTLESIQTVSNYTYLAAGTTTVELRFTGWMILDSYWNGPYDVYLYLYDSGSREVDYAYYYTSSYAYTDFEDLPAAFGSPHEAYVEDADSDGDYDGLFVNVTVVVSSPGLYLVQGYLYDSGWNWVAGAGSWATLSVGTHVVQIEFPAWMINGHGADGTFWVYLYLYDSEKNNLDFDSLLSASYANETFDSTVPRIDSTWASTAPAIDGVFTAGEWTGAAWASLWAADTYNEVYGSMLVMNDATNLYIAYDAYGDRNQDNGDYSAFAFDTGNDGLRTNGAEDAFLLTGTSKQHSVYSTGSSTWVWHCNDDTSQLEHDTMAATVGFGTSDVSSVDHRIYEFSIPLALLNIAPGDIIGFVGRAWNTYGLYNAFNGTTSAWPVMFSSAPTMAQYADLHLADAVIVIPAPVTTSSVAGTAGTAGWYKTQATVTLSATGGDGGVDYTEYRLDGGSWTTYSAALDITVQGIHTLEFRSVDHAAQVEATKTLTVKIDSGLPTTATAQSGSLLWLNATDATSGVGSVMFRVNNGAWNTYTGVLDMAFYGVGTHTVDFYCTDSAGNAEAMQSISVVVEDDGGNPDDGPGILGGPLLWIGLIAAAIAAALILLLLVLKRKKGQQPVQMMPPQGYVMQPEQLPPPPQA